MIMSKTKTKRDTTVSVSTDVKGSASTPKPREITEFIVLGLTSVLFVVGFGFWCYCCWRHAVDEEKLATKQRLKSQILSRDIKCVTGEGTTPPSWPDRLNPEKCPSIPHGTIMAPTKIESHGEILWTFQHGYQRDDSVPRITISQQTLMHDKPQHPFRSMSRFDRPRPNLKSQASITSHTRHNRYIQGPGPIPIMYTTPSSTTDTNPNKLLINSQLVSEEHSELQQPKAMIYPSTMHLRPETQSMKRLRSQASFLSGLFDKKDIEMHTMQPSPRSFVTSSSMRGRQGVGKRMKGGWLREPSHK